MANLATTEQIQRFCFTLNNFTPDEREIIKNFATHSAKFAIIGVEIGENKTPHLQGFMNLSKRTRFSAIKKIMPRAHVERAYGSDHDNLDYCSKLDQEPFIVGQPSFAGKRTDLATVCESLKTGGSISAIIVEHPDVYAKYSRGLHAIANHYTPPRDPLHPPTVFWFYGATGGGKTRTAYGMFEQHEIYAKDLTQWWDGYDHQECILVDDFDGKWPFRDFLRFIDRYPYKGQTKGGYVEINSPYIIITCEVHPNSYYFDTQLQQVLRRLHEVRLIGVLSTNDIQSIAKDVAQAAVIKILDGECNGWGEGV